MYNGHPGKAIDQQTRERVYELLRSRELPWRKIAARLAISTATVCNLSRDLVAAGELGHQPKTAVPIRESTQALRREIRRSLADDV